MLPHYGHQPGGTHQELKEIPRWANGFNLILIAHGGPDLKYVWGRGGDCAWFLRMVQAGPNAFWEHGHVCVWEWEGGGRGRAHCPCDDVCVRARPAPGCAPRRTVGTPCPGLTAWQPCLRTQLPEQQRTCLRACAMAPTWRCVKQLGPGTSPGRAMRWATAPPTPLWLGSCTSTTLRMVLYESLHARSCSLLRMPRGCVMEAAWGSVGNLEPQ